MNISPVTISVKFACTLYSFTLLLFSVLIIKTKINGACYISAPGGLWTWPHMMSMITASTSCTMHFLSSFISGMKLMRNTCKVSVFFLILLPIFRGFFSIDILPYRFTLLFAEQYWTLLLRAEPIKKNRKLTVTAWFKSQNIFLYYFSQIIRASIALIKFKP